MNILAGQNNVGKSNLLELIRRVATPDAEFHELDVPVDDEDEDERVHCFFLAVTREALTHRLVSRRGQNNSNISLWVEALFSDPAFRLTEDDLAWIEFKISHFEHSSEPRFILLNEEQAARVTGRAAESAAVNLAKFLTAQSFPDGLFRNVRVVLEQLRLLDGLPSMRFIEAARQIKPQDDFTELISTIDHWKNPGSSRAERRLEEKYKNLNQLVRDVLGDPSAEVRVPSDRESIQVSLAGVGSLPLQNLGSGVHQLVRVAVAATEAERELVCIEEPEVHMHPIMQRRLIRFLREHTSNQYIVATHSSAFIDEPTAAVFSVVQDAKHGTQVERVIAADEKWTLVQDLGYRASDLLQSNIVLWVEGPSDRIYLRHWLDLIAPELNEGADYTIMFYGGQLLSHLSTGPDGSGSAETRDLVELCRLCRSFVFVFDSDRTAEGADLGEPKTAILNEVEGHDERLVWVTDGYTIENYVPRELLAAAVVSVHPKLVFEWSGNDTDPPFRGIRVDKVSVARAVTARWQDQDMFPAALRDHLSRVVSLIRSSNSRT